MWNEGTSNYDSNQGHDRPRKTYADIIRLQSRETSKHPRTGWDDEIHDSSGPAPEDETSTSFLQNIKNIKDKTINDILALIPEYATGVNTSHKKLEGFEYKWTDPQGRWWRVLAHGPDGNPDISKETNASKGWTVRVQRNEWYMDSSGDFHQPEIAQSWKSLHANESIINDTHIPIQTPNEYKCPIKNPNPQLPWGRAQLQLRERHDQLSTKYQ